MVEEDDSRFDFLPRRVHELGILPPPCRLPRVCHAPESGSLARERPKLRFKFLALHGLVPGYGNVLQELGL
jgi:hypothetical protein